MQSSGGARAFQNARLQKKLMKQADAILSAAAAAYGQGRYAETEALCREILKAIPDHVDSMHLLGMCAHDRRRLEEAQQLLERVIELDPRLHDAHNNLATVHFDLGDYEEARRCQERAIALKPNFAVALTNLGNTLMHLGLYGQALELHERAIKLKPDYADAFCNRGMVEILLGQVTRAKESFERALLFQPRHAEAIVGKGMVSMELRHHEEAAAKFAMALAIKPDSPRILAQRGRLSYELQRLEQALADFEAALAISPKLELALRGKAQACLVMGKTAQAMAAATTLIERNPRSEIGLALMGFAYSNQGEMDAAIDYLDRALAIRPDYGDAIRGKIFLQDYRADADFAVQQAVRRDWWDLIGSKLPRRELPKRPLDPEKRIVVGYVAAEFRQHSAGLTLLPVLRHHDHARFEIICYYSWPGEDEYTAKFKQMADVWVDAWQLSDDELADRIQADNVDILIDVSGHTTANRLQVFARKPAPIQATGFGHATGTGMQTMDYVLADSIFIPPSVRHLFAERIHDLPCLITMEPVADLQPSELPMLRKGYVTFGVFNRIYKISDDAIRVWSRLMREVPGSKIVLKHGLLDDPLLRDGLIARFAAQGIAEEHITCMGSTSRNDHLLAFANIDISLDTFPQNGGISTWESLYKGVPVVARLGNGASSRAGASIVTAVGLGDWVAEDDEGYIEIARKFATQPDHLAKLRAELPAQIAASPAGNVEIYTRELEAGYRQFWRDYCAAASESGDAA
ncbi:tetratricopeptide repeat protein [Bradyrhizobium sp. 180]|uniref:O-linked N-acetylglucosamine transferase, SPINDLY family protein n=1 Tax=unclassified Bradyrhizobium TaxID=2631580 RepID=UPI001FF867BB|nr:MULTISPECIES: tetratricopeptide repeat protein [unclassified Bradyrhizobium]MCK1424741.1 tetratricopeptide repeat protein [Bradyrhizobium sp. CW12]MCK1491229.1 tetratricopeptide repeat protein [Bradyrhizobium sp. 180]MCK1530059.1 tetratricopeptide repeat protein [Bradyrhizobium sp. 182]MCK1593934.1 tetratricopeptide repeat protein [Bradyrhizobium sp. 164]MCK1649610.1 tetratricopeptide repeat protein [Bradyrhizobium sp. 154]